MLAKRHQLYKNVFNMSGEHQPTVTGDKPARVTFSPEASGYQVTGVPARESLAKAVQNAMMLELAAARARVLELESERDELREASAEPVFAAEVDLTDGIEEAIAAQAADALADGGLAPIGEDPAVPEAEAEPPAPAEPDPVEPEIPAPAEPDELETPPPAPAEGGPIEETKPSRNETKRLSRISQTEILREIIMHEDFVPDGRLDAPNVSGLIKKLVQERTGMSDAQWKNAYTVLRQKDLINLCPYDDNPKKSYAVIVDMKRLAEFIEKSKLFEREEDANFKEYFAELCEKKVKPDDSKASAVPAPPAAAPSPSVAPKPASPPAYQMSTKQRRQFEYEESERLEREAARNGAKPGTVRAARRSFVEDFVGPVEVIVPKYDEVTEAEWEAIDDDDVRFLLALSSNTVRAVDSTKSDKLLLAIVEAGGINANDNDGVYDPKIMSSIIKELRLPPQPKIVFSQPGGKVKLELTKAGEEYLAIQFRKVRLAVTRAREARPKAGKTIKAA